MRRDGDSETVSGAWLYLENTVGVHAHVEEGLERGGVVGDSGDMKTPGRS